jgi:hypothetical protein
VGWSNGTGECQRRRRVLGFDDFHAYEGGGVGGVLGGALPTHREKGEELGRGGGGSGQSATRMG